MKDVQTILADYLEKLGADGLMHPDSFPTHLLCSTLALRYCRFMLEPKLLQLVPAYRYLDGSYQIEPQKDKPKEAPDGTKV
jgi:hypothetical protein